MQTLSWKDVGFETEKLRNWISPNSSANTLKVNYIKAKIDDVQRNSKCRLYSDNDETITHIVSKRSKPAQKEYNTRLDWVGKVIHWELCKKLKFDHTTKWYIQLRIHPGEWDA